MTAFERLHPRLRHAIVHDLGWRSLRPVQEAATHAILDGHNAVILAPTAGGKTEAALFPVLSQILCDDRAPVAALYVCPIRALLNNQETRLGQYTRMVGLDAFKWHGDVSASNKTRFGREPAHLLMTTPESIEVMLLSAKANARAWFSALSTVVIDEVHAFAGDDRGAHLVALLERLCQFCGRDLQRIGLSATVGNPAMIGEWLAGSSRRELALVDPPRPPVTRDLRVYVADDVAEAAEGIATLARGKKSLVFVESRARAERVAQALDGSGIEVFIHHSSVSRADRAAAEERFLQGTNTAIVATSTLELGIDVGDLDHVFQVDAPPTVAAFLQRMGRTGRRAGTRSNCTLFCLTSESLLQAVALTRLAEQGWVEDVQPVEGATHVLAHQVLALVLQESGLSRHRVLPWISQAWPFATIREPHLHALIDTMVEREILHEADGSLSMGTEGERIYGRKNFFELYAVFSSPPMLRVLHGRDDVGLISAWFVLGQDPTDGPLCFRLGGRAWQIARLDLGRGRVDVRPAENGRVPSWLGNGSVLSGPLAQAMLRVLAEPGGETAWLTPSAQRALNALREGYDGLLEVGAAPVEDHADGVMWHTFAGGAVNRLLAAGMERLTGAKWVAGNLMLKTKASNGAKVSEALGRLGELGWEALALQRARGLARGQISKFQPCLPQAAEDRLLAERLLDVPGTLQFLATTRIGGERVFAGIAQRVDVNADVHGAPERGARAPEPAPYVPKLPREFVRDAESLARVVAELCTATFVALDVETTLDTHALCLVQFATSSGVMILDPLAVPDLGPIRAILENPSVVKVIHNAPFERRVLGRLGFRVEPVFDTLVASRALRGRSADGGHSLGAVCGRELGVALDKSMQTSAWARRPLTSAQMAYAAADVEVLVDLYRRFVGDGATPAPTAAAGAGLDNPGWITP